MTNLFVDLIEFEDIFKRLDASDDEVRRLALIELADLGDEEHASIFVDALRDPSPSVRLEAARGLEAFESGAAVAALAQALSDADAEGARPPRKASAN